VTGTRASRSAQTPRAREGQLRINVTRGFEDVAGLEQQWRQFEGPALTANFEHFHTVIDSEPTMHEPVVLTVLRDDAPESMIVARVEDVTLAFKLGYRAVWRPSVRSLTVVYRGFLGHVDDEVSDRVVDELTGMLEQGELEAVIFRRLSLDHPLYRAATTRPRYLMRQHYTRFVTCWERTLPPSFDLFLASLSKSTRTSAKRYANKLERDYASRLEVRKLSSPTHLDDYFRDAETVASKSYQRGLGVGVRDDPAHRFRAGLAAERGWFRAYILYLDRAPVAFCGGESYAGRFYYGIPGYDPAFRDYRVGQLVLLRMIEDLCEDEEVQVVDFGPGDAEYKRRFGDRSWQEADVHVFAPRLRPVAVNLGRTTILRANDAMATAARELRIFGRIKRAWRRRASSFPS